MDLRWATTAGVNLSRLVLCRPESGEQALQVASVLVGSGAVEVLVIDSIAALVPKAELAADIGERIPGVQANLLSQALRQLCGPIARANSEVLVTNQLRQRAGAPGTPTCTAGGAGAWVLRLGASGPAPPPSPQRGRAGGRQSPAGAGGQEQARPDWADRRAGGAGRLRCL